MTVSAPLLIKCVLVAGARCVDKVPLVRQHCWNFSCVGFHTTWAKHPRQPSFVIVAHSDTPGCVLKYLWSVRKLLSSLWKWPFTLCRWHAQSKIEGPGKFRAGEWKRKSMPNSHQYSSISHPPVLCVSREIQVCWTLWTVRTLWIKCLQEHCGYWKKTKQ